MLRSSRVHIDQQRGVRANPETLLHDRYQVALVEAGHSLRIRFRSRIPTWPQMRYNMSLGADSAERCALLMTKTAKSLLVRIHG